MIFIDKIFYEPGLRSIMKLLLRSHSCTLCSSLNNPPLPLPGGDFSCRFFHLLQQIISSLAIPLSNAKAITFPFLFI